MQKARTFWHVLKHSLVPLDYYYHQLRSTKFIFSFKYFVTLIMTTVLVATVLKSTIFIKEYTPQELATLIQTIENSYPEELTININELGRLSTNAEKPYILFSPIEKNPEPLVVIDPKAEKEKIFEYETHVLLTERQMIILSGDNLYEFNYQLDQPIKIDKSDVMTISHNAQVVLDSYWMFAAVIIVAALIIAPPILIIANLVTLAIASVLAFIIMKLFVKRRKFTLDKIFQISLHSITGPLILQGFMFVFALSSSLPYWYILMVYIFLAGGIYEAYFDKK